MTPIPHRKLRGKRAVKREPDAELPISDEEDIGDALARDLEAIVAEDIADMLDEDDGDRTSEERAAATDVIRNFAGDALLLTYVRTSPNPYKEDDADTIEIYADDRGFEYWIDPKGNVLVQAGPSARVHPAPRQTRDEDRRSVGELRAAALTVVCAQVPGFAERRSSYHPLEDNRNRETYFFRWDDFSQPAKESELPPFVQVGLHADGTLASYTNTLRRG